MIKEKRPWYEDVEAPRPSKGIFAQIQDMPVSEGFATQKEFWDAYRESLKKPKYYEGSTICGRMIWRDKERQAIVTCTFDDCIICNSINNICLKEAKRKK